jgi:hypothetical protein
MHDGSNSYMIIFVSNKCFGLMNIGGRGATAGQEEVSHVFIPTINGTSMPPEKASVFEPTRCKYGCAVTR